MELPSPYFDNDLFKKALTCPAKLYYYKQPELFPQKNDGNYFGTHTHNMRQKLKTLARIYYPGGTAIPADNSQMAHRQTIEELKKSQTILYNGQLIRGRSKIIQPIIDKQHETISLISVHLRVARIPVMSEVKIRKHAFGRWRRYLAELAFSKWVFEEYFHPKNIKCLLMVPNGNTRNEVAQAYHKLDLKKNDYELKNEIQKEFRQAENLLLKADVTKYVNEVLTQIGLPVRTNTKLDKLPFKEVLKTLEELWTQNKQYKPPLDKRCKQCEFRIPTNALSSPAKSGFACCWSDIVKQFNEQANRHHILSLSGHGKQQFIDRDIYSITSIDTDKLNLDEQQILSKNGAISQAERQYFQVRKSQERLKTKEFVKKNLFYELVRWNYPLHFIDFEAAMLPVPLRQDGYPYEILVFQFSCHTLYETGKLVHNEWIEAEPGVFPNFKMVRAFLELPDIEKGTLVQYSPFEKDAFKKIQKQFVGKNNLSEEDKPLAKRIHKIISRRDSRKDKGPYFADMNRILTKFYYNYHMEGKMGIKNALEAMFKISPVLKQKYQKPVTGTNFNKKIWWQINKESGLVISPYNLLNSEIAEGSDAFAVYGKLQEQNISRKHRNRLIKSLRQYCELDTLAMVMIFEHWSYLRQGKKVPSPK